MRQTASRPAARAGLTSSGVSIVKSVAWLVLLLVLSPLVVLIGASFAEVSYVTFPPIGCTWKWYSAFFNDFAFVNSLILSGQIAVASAFFATILGLPAAYVMIRKRFPGQALVWNLFLSPFLVPQVVLGVALLQFFTMLGLATSLAGLLLAHIVSVIPYVIRTVGASLLTVDPSIEEAAADLGASRLQTLVFVVAPMARGGVIAGALFAFIMSWVNVEISIFLSVTGGYTPPVVLFNYLEYSITTVVVAAASIAIYVAVLLVFIIDRIIGSDNATKL